MNILPQPETAVDAIVVASMSAEEARQCIDQIKTHLNSVRVLLLDLDSRRGWEALGYKSIRQCLKAELQGKLGKSLSQLYRELAAGKIEWELSHRCDTIGSIPERHLEPLTKLPPEQWRDVWEEINKTAPESGVTRRHVQSVVSRRLENSRLSELLRLQATPTADQEVVLGEWVEVRTRHGNATWDGLRGPVTRVEQYEITVQLDEGKWKHLRFYRDELVKVPAPNDELNQMIEGAISPTPPKSFYKSGDIVFIDCPASAGQEYRQWNGCWGLVKSVGQLGSVEVLVAGKTMRFSPNDLDILDNPSPLFVSVAEKVVRLLKRDDLDEFERQLLTLYLRRQTFSQRQLELLTSLVEHYENSDNLSF